MRTVQDLISLGAVGIILVAITQFLKEKEYFQTTPTDKKETKEEEVKCPECPGCGAWFWFAMLGIIVLVIQIVSSISTGGVFQSFFLFQALGGLFNLLGSLLKA